MQSFYSFTSLSQSRSDATVAQTAATSDPSSVTFLTNSACRETDGSIPVLKSESCLAKSLIRVCNAGSVMVLTNVIKASLEEDSKVASASKQQKKTTMQLVARTKSMQTTRSHRLDDGPLGDQAS